MSAITPDTVDTTSPGTGTVTPLAPGTAFRFWQPRNLASWVYLYFLVMGAIASYHYFRPGIGIVNTAVIAAFALFGLYTLPWIWLLRRVDRWSHIPGKLALAAFLWGLLTAAFFLALPANGALMGIYSKVFSPVWVQDWGPGFTAPFNEETAKGIGILLLIFMATAIIRNPFDGFIVGAFVGLGFEIIEDVSYAVNEAISRFGTEQVEAVFYITMLRGAVGITSHALFSALVGAGLVYLIGTPVSRPNRMIGVGLIVVALVFHGVWDAASAIGGELGIPAIVIIVGAIVIELLVLWAIYRFVSNTERTWVRNLRGPEGGRWTMSAG